MMVTIVIAPVEVFIECCCVFLDFCLGATNTPLVISCTVSISVYLSSKWEIVTTTGDVFISIICCCCFPTESALATLELEFVSFSVPVEAMLV